MFEQFYTITVVDYGVAQVVLPVNPALPQVTVKDNDAVQVVVRVETD